MEKQEKEKQKQTWGWFLLSTPALPQTLTRPVLSHRVEQLRVSVITTIACRAYPVSAQAWEPLRRRRSKVTCECSCGGASNKAKGRLVQNGLHIPPAQAEHGFKERDVNTRSSCDYNTRFQMQILGHPPLSNRLSLSICLTHLLRPTLSDFLSL